MKKIVSLLLALMMACTLIFAAAAEETVTGIWYLNEVQMEGLSLNPATLGVEMTITLNEDGTCVSETIQDEETEETLGTWEMGDGVVIVAMEGEEEPSEFAVEDGQLSADLGGVIGIFGREAPEALVAPEIVPAENEDAFLGIWTLSSIGIGDTIFPAAAMGMETTMTIAAGKVTLISGDEPDEYTSEFADGALKATNPEGEEMALSLTDAGSVAITYELDEETAMILYFEPVK